MSATSRAPDGLDTASGSSRQPGRTGRVLAFVLTLLVIMALATWITLYRPSSTHFGDTANAGTRPKVTLQFTMEVGNLTLSYSQPIYVCADLPSGAPSREISIRYTYQLSNIGDSRIAVTVFLSVDFSSVAQHAYDLAPHQVTNDTIGITMTYDGPCEGHATGLGLSMSYPG